MSAAAPLSQEPPMSERRRTNSADIAFVLAIGYFWFLIAVTAGGHK